MAGDGRELSGPGFIIQAMRIFLLALMIALLPLRGWVGDVMAMAQVGQALAAARTPALHSDGHQTRPQHHGQLDAAHEDLATVSEHGSHQSGGDCAGCTVCQICHSVALAGLPCVSSAAVLPTAVAQTPAQLYASAEHAPGFKPPIS